MLEKAHPLSFYDAIYDGLPHLDQMRFDLNSLYEYLYLHHSIHFQGLRKFDEIYQPKKNLLIAQNRQICVAQMEYVARGILSLIRVHAEILISKRVSPDRLSAIQESFYELAETLYGEALFFVNRFHGKKIPGTISYIPDARYYTSSGNLDLCIEAQSGLNWLYQYILTSRIASPTPIMISYRNDAAGKGAVFDHATLQSITQRDTVVLNGANLPLLIETALFDKNFPLLTYGVPHSTVGHKRPLYLSDIEPIADLPGLIIIPGFPENQQYIKPEIAKEQLLRKKYEEALIKKSISKQPILFICGGLYRFCEAYLEKVDFIKGHTGKMPSFINKILVNNEPAHPVNLKPNSKASKLCGFNEYDNNCLMVTSVHHKAAKEPFSPSFNDQFEVVGRAPSGSVEIIESKGDGATAIGVQFHPETVTGDSPDEQRQQRLINELANEADQINRRHIINKKEKLYFMGEIFTQLGDPELNGMVDDLIKEAQLSQKKPSASPQIPGLEYIPLPGYPGQRFHGLFHAAAVFLKEHPKQIRQKVADYLQAHKNDPEIIEDITKGYLEQDAMTIDEYIKEVRIGLEDYDGLEIISIMHTYNRPLFIVTLGNIITNKETALKFAGSPIFVYHDGNNHYDGFVLKNDSDSSKILEDLLAETARQEAKKPVSRPYSTEPQAILETPNFMTLPMSTIPPNTTFMTPEVTVPHISTLTPNVNTYVGYILERFFLPPPKFGLRLTEHKALTDLEENTNSFSN